MRAFETRSLSRYKLRAMPRRRARAVAARPPAGGRRIRSPRPAAPDCRCSSCGPCPDSAGPSRREGWPRCRPDGCGCTLGLACRCAVPGRPAPSPARCGTGRKVPPAGTGAPERRRCSRCSARAVRHRRGAGRAYRSAPAHSSSRPSRLRGRHGPRSSTDTRPIPDPSGPRAPAPGHRQPDRWSRPPRRAARRTAGGLSRPGQTPTTGMPRFRGPRARRAFPRRGKCRVRRPEPRRPGRSAPAPRLRRAGAQRRQPGRPPRNHARAMIITPLNVT